MATKTEAIGLLRVALAELYGERKDAERIVADAELSRSAIAFSDKALTNCYNILSETEKQQKVGQIIELARAEYPAHVRLCQAGVAYLVVTGQMPAASNGDLARRGPLEPVGGNDGVQ